MNAHALEVRALRARVAALEAELARHTLHASDSRERHLHTAAMASHEHATDVHLLKQRRILKSHRSSRTTPRCARRSTTAAASSTAR